MARGKGKGVDQGGKTKRIQSQINNLNSCLQTYRKTFSPPLPLGSVKPKGCLNCKEIYLNFKSFIFTSFSGITYVAKSTLINLNKYKMKKLSIKIALAVVMIAAGTLGLQAQNGKGAGARGTSTGTRVNSGMMTGAKNGGVCTATSQQAAQTKSGNTAVKSGTGTGVCDGTGVATSQGKKQRKGK
jgi:hypothetical protein